MRYIVIMKNSSAFMTGWYTYENCWTEDVFCVVDIFGGQVTFDGSTWEIVAEDHL